MMKNIASKSVSCAGFEDFLVLISLHGLQI